MTTTLTPLARVVAAASLAAVGATALHAPHASAASYADHAASTPGLRALTLHDFYDEIDARDVSNTDDGTVNGHVFKRAIGLDTEETYVSLKTSLFPGYRTLEFHLGVSDTAAPPMTSVLVVQADGLTIKRYTVSLNKPAIVVDVPLAGHKIITLKAKTPDHSIDDLVIGDPLLR